jgi:hypothetical protein
MTRVISASGLMFLLLLASPRQGIGQVARTEGAAGNPGNVVSVDAMHPWVDSGVTVRKGQRVSFSAEGTIQWGSRPDQVAGPEGHRAKPGKVGAGGLIGRVGYTGKPFAIGNTRTPIAMPANGKLFLGINDFIFGDNSGAFAVTINSALTH